MDTERKAFEDAIAADRHDGVTRLVFADWLNEHGCDDEAAEQRRCATAEWQEADRWMHEFVDRINGRHADDEDSYYTKLTFDQLIQAASDYLDSGERFFLNYDIPEVVYDKREVFWKMFAEVTGREVDEALDDTIFRCAC